jgi:AraC-like DNA-binding protein
LAALAILQPDARAEARLSGALTATHDVLLSTSWDHLEASLGEHGMEACVVDVDQPDRELASRRIAALRGRYSDLAIVACVESEDAEGFFGLGGLGVDGVVFSASRPSKIRSDLDLALSASRAQRVERRLRPRIPPPGPAAVAWAMEHAGQSISVERLAGALGHTSRSLRDTFQDAGLPSPARVLLWGRLLVAGARLGNDGRRVEDVAFSLGYATSTSFARAMKLHTGLTAASVSRVGGMEAVLDALVDGWDGGEAGHAEQKRPNGDNPTGGSAGKRSRMARVALVAGAIGAAASSMTGPAGSSATSTGIDVAAAPSARPSTPASNE